LLPVAPHRERDPDRRRGVARAHRPVQDRSDVVMVALEPAEPASLVVAGQLRGQRLREHYERLRVASFDLRSLAGFGQPLGGELPDRVEHPEPRLTVDLLDPDQALVGEGHEAVEDLDAVELAGRPADRLRAVDLAPADEHAQPGEQPALAGGQEVVTPGDRAAERLLSLGEIARASRQDAELVLQSFEDRIWREELDPRRGELDRERHA